MKIVAQSWLFLGIAAWVLSSCSQKVEVAPPVQRPIYVGRIDHVYPSQNYVLIRLFGNVPEEGTTLISHAPDGDTSSRMANLRVSAERLGRIRVPADIRSGTALAGDLVFQYQNMASPTMAKQPDTPAPTETPQPTTTEEPTFPSFDDDTPKPVTAPAETPIPELKEELPQAPDLPGNADDLGDLPTRIEDEG